MIDDFKVPGDNGYKYDDFGGGKVLCLEYLEPLIKKLNLGVFFPAIRAEQETGEKRGCVVMAQAPDILKILKGNNTLTFYNIS